MPSTQILVIRPKKDKVIPKYLLDQLLATPTQQQIKHKARGLYILRIRPKDINELVLSIPSIQEQTKQIHEISNLESKIEKLVTRTTFEKNPIVRSLDH